MARTNDQGFTLVEVLVVVAIIGLLAAIAIPQFSLFLTKARQAESRTILDGLRIAEYSYYSSEGTWGLGTTAPGVPLRDYLEVKNKLGFEVVGNPKYYNAISVVPDDSNSPKTDFFVTLTATSPGLDGDIAPDQVVMHGALPAVNPMLISYCTLFLSYSAANCPAGIPLQAIDDVRF